MASQNLLIQKVLVLGVTESVIQKQQQKKELLSLTDVLCF